MLPGKLEMSRDECRKYLRSLELDAYASMVSVLRAQGPFTNDKRKLLEELSGVLHISNERHRAEIRRAVNDDKLTTVAEQLSGPNTGTDWATEGRRIVPLIPRLKARNAFTTLANTLSLVTALANKKQPPTAEEIKDTRVKMERDLDIQHILSSEEETSASSSVEPEINYNDRKRKRSVTESSDTEGSTFGKEKIRQKEEWSTVLSSSNEDPKFPSFSHPSGSKGLIIPPSSTLGALKLNASNRSSPEDIMYIPSSTSNIATTKNITVIPVGISDVGTISTALCKNAYNIKTVQSNQSVNASVIPCVTSAVKSKVNILSSQVKAAVVGPRHISVSIPSNTLHPRSSDIDKSELQNVQIKSDKSMEHYSCDTKLISLTNDVSRSEDASTSRSYATNIMSVSQTSSTSYTAEKQMISNINAWVASVSAANTTSSGPGPPCVKPSLVVAQAYKTLPPVKPNNHPTTKMSLSLNSSKAISINSQSNVRSGTKANLILVQKGPKTGVTLSHGGKEVIGKVIMGGNNLCFANQPNHSSLAVVPRVSSNNGDQNDSECTKPTSKPGNMIVLDIRQDVIDKNNVFPQFFETAGAFDAEVKTTVVNPTTHFVLKDQSNNAPSIGEKNSPLNDTSEVAFVQSQKEESQEMSSNIIYEDADITKVIEKASDREHLFIYKDEDAVIEGTLDPQTGIYKIQSSDDAISNIQYGETLTNAVPGIFDLTLESEKITSKNLKCMKGDDSSISVSKEAKNLILTLKKSDKFNNSLNY